MSQGESRESSTIGPTISTSKVHGEYLDPGYRTSFSKTLTKGLQLVFTMLNSQIPETMILEL